MSNLINLRRYLFPTNCTYVGVHTCYYSCDRFRLIILAIVKEIFITKEQSPCVSRVSLRMAIIISRNMSEVYLYTSISTDVLIVGNKYILIYIYCTEDVRHQESIVKKTTVHGLHRTASCLGWVEICVLLNWLHSATGLIYRVAQNILYTLWHEKYYSIIVTSVFIQKQNWYERCPWILDSM